MPLKIRTRLLIAFMVMTLPLILLIAIIYYDHNIIYSGIHVLEKIAEDIKLNADLQLALERVVMPPNDYLITGDLTERKRFKTLADDVENRFNTLIQLDIETEEEIAILKAARERFSVLKGKTEEILAIKEPIGNQEGARLMLEMDTIAHGIINDYIVKHYQIDKRALEEALEMINNTRKRSLIVMIIAPVTLTAFGIFFAFFYSNIFVRPIKKLHNGAAVMASGNFEHHLEIHTGDEIEQLAKEFNNMGDKLKGSYEALEDKVIKRTRKLQERVDELERFRRATVDREFRMKEMKDRVRELEKDLDRRKGS